MMNEGHRMHARVYGTLIARILMGGFFLLAGISKIMDFAGTVGYTGTVLPAPELMVIIAIILEVVGGLGLILGWHVGYSAVALIIFTVVASFGFHGPNMWSPDDPTQQIMFMKNFALIGGLLYMLAYGAGEGWALGKKKHSAE